MDENDCITTNHDDSDGDNQRSMLNNEAEEQERSNMTWKDHGRRIFAASWPQTTILACQSIMAMTNTAVLGYLGSQELAAAAFAGIVLNLTGAVLVQGACETLITLTSQAIGANSPKLAGVWLQTGIFVIVVAAIPIGVCWWFTGAMLHWVGMEAAVVTLANTFARYSLIVLIPDAAFQAFYMWLNAQQLVRPTIAINIFYVLFNLGANMLLVHGVPGYWAGVGFVGSPVAAAGTAMLRGVTVVWWVCHVKQLHRSTWPGWTKASVSRKRILAFLKLALPSMLSGLLEQAQFVVVTIMVAGLGVPQVAAHSGMLNVFTVMSCIMFSIMDSCSAIIGKFMGAKEVRHARQASLVVFLMLLATAFIVAFLFCITAPVIGKLFSQDPEVWALAESLSLLLGCAYVLFSITMAAYAVLQGQGRPTIGALSMLVGLWGVSLPMAYVFGFVWKLNLLGVWVGLTCGYSVMTILLAVAVLCSKWDRLAQEALERVKANAVERRSSSQHVLAQSLL